MTQIIPFVPNKQLPAHVSNFLAGHSNIDPKATVPQLSYRGKVWRIVIDGVEKPILNKDDEPVSTVHVVIIDHNKARSRAYYEGAYEEGKAQAPACSSIDGEVPDAGIKEPKARTCASCPHSVKGSKITANGKETTACSVYKRIAIVPLSDMTEPLLLRLAQTSVWDKNNEENEAKGYYAWDQYLDMLRSNGANHTAAVATKIRFDSRMAYPKLVFAASRWLSDEELEEVKPLFKDERVAALLKAPELQVSARSTKSDDDDIEPTKKGSDQVVDVDQADDDEAPPPKATKAAKPANGEDEDDEAPPPPRKVKAAKPAEEEEDAPPPPAAKGAKSAKSAKSAKAVEPDEDEAPPPPAKGKGKAKEKDAKGLSDLVDEWDD